MGKFYSAGLDINTETPLNQDPHQIAHDMGLLQKLVARLLTFPLPTIAAITGLVHLPPVYMRFPLVGIIRYIATPLLFNNVEMKTCDMDVHFS